MSKDQTIGAIIFVLCIFIAVLYVVTLFYPQWVNILGTQTVSANLQFWIIAVPVLIAFVAVLGIGAWIGWTMSTTPPPKPIEETASLSETAQTEGKELEKQ